MELTKVAQLNSLDEARQDSNSSFLSCADDSGYLDECYFTDGLDSTDEYNNDDLDLDLDPDSEEDGSHNDCGYDDDDNCADDWNSSNGSILDYNAGSLEDFTYEDEGKIYAEGHAIRLIRLLNGTGPIQAFLFKAFLHKTGNGMPYEALSYTWGSPDLTRHIGLNGKRFSCTENLYSALRYLRLENEERILWIDAICIDQNHIAERNHQVSHMASIYHDAEKVIFWLGEPTYETGVLISSLLHVQARAFEGTPELTLKDAEISRVKTLWDDEIWCEDTLASLKGLKLLLARPWFSRSWILQEVCFAKTGVVTCGRNTIAAHMFALAPPLLDVDLEAHCQEVLQMMPAATRSARTSHSGREMRNLHSLLQRFYRSNASDPRDQVYALLNMATDANRAGFPKVDYKKYLEEVLDCIFTYLFPYSWAQRGRSYRYQSLSQFVNDFLHLEGVERLVCKAVDDHMLSKASLLVHTGLNHTHLQEVFEAAIQSRNDRIASGLLRFPDIDLNAEERPYENSETKNSSTYEVPPMCAAAAYGLTEIVTLLSEGSPSHDINSVDSKFGRTPLSWAAKNGHESAVDILLATGKAEVNSMDVFGRTPLLWAAANGHEAIVALLLYIGQAAVNLKTRCGQTPLMCAARAGHDAIVELLLRTEEAHIDVKDHYWRTALSYAIINRREAVIKLLHLAYRGDMKREDECKQTRV
ncbi:hypothetical protein N0V83_009537 [Neocucurbitaria cava]|uniref:Heterokaryon incompatibility domain-containing protein n=1 Tax=Neocucurbitaria cava TaxID=798079 RepID=A0A9W9CHM7_9PLEO|nr:hypothetical protein N0V83_009537 [Neocucurbitaria cava]